MLFVAPMSGIAVPSRILKNYTASFETSISYTLIVPETSVESFVLRTKYSTRMSITMNTLKDSYLASVVLIDVDSESEIDLDNLKDSTLFKAINSEKNSSLIEKSMHRYLNMLKRRENFLASIGSDRANDASPGLGGGVIDADEDFSVLEDDVMTEQPFVTDAKVEAAEEPVVEISDEEIEKAERSINKSIEFIESKLVTFRTQSMKQVMDDDYPDDLKTEIIGNLTLSLDSFCISGGISSELAMSDDAQS